MYVKKRESSGSLLFTHQFSLIVCYVPGIMLDGLEELVVTIETSP